MFFCVIEGKVKEEYWFFMADDFSLDTCIELTCTLHDYCEQGEFSIEVVNKIRDLYNNAEADSLENKDQNDFS